ncbi:MAG: hypothetical protein ABIR96_04480 [Bdellovibrionota bacterium]
MRVFDSSKIPPPRGFESFRAPPGFDRYALEIGAGAGWHATVYATTHPETCLFAVEHSRARFSRLESRARHAHLKNFLIFHADAESFVVHCVADVSLDRVMILYPNPYPKASQSNKRWHEMPFMAALLSKMKAEAVLEFATNEDSYAADFFERMTETWGLEIIANQRISKDADPDFKARTHFEKKYFERGEMLHLMEFRRPLSR